MHTLASAHARAHTTMHKLTQKLGYEAAARMRAVVPSLRPRMVTVRAAGVWPVAVRLVGGKGPGQGTIESVCGK